MSSFTPPGDCPVCGTQVPARAKACPECGASATAGWGDDDYLDGIDLPPTADEESPESPQKRKPSLAFNLAVVVLLALILSGLWYLV